MPTFISLSWGSETHPLYQSSGHFIVHCLPLSCKIKLHWRSIHILTLFQSRRRERSLDGFTICRFPFRRYDSSDLLILYVAPETESLRLKSPLSACSSNHPFNFGLQTGRLTIWLFELQYSPCTRWSLCVSAFVVCCSPIANGSVPASIQS